MHIVILQRQFSSFLSSCYRRAHDDYGITFTLISKKLSPQNPYDDSIYKQPAIVRHHYEEHLTDEEIKQIIAQNSPDIILACGWAERRYLKICKWFKKRGGKVVAYSDSQRRGTFKQRVGSILSSYILKPSIDVIWAAGDRQRDYASYLGYQDHEIWEGSLTCDWDLFSQHRAKWRPPSDQFFLYVGRYREEKGIRILAEAYKQYQKSTNNSWKLICAGRGPLQQLLIDSGAVDRGFVQPNDLPSLMSQASGFILPSITEPWGVVLHEATAAGLPIITTRSCGASVHLHKDYFNGYSSLIGNPESLREQMLKLSSLNQSQWEIFSENSFQLSKQYTPARWAKILYEGVQKLQRESQPNLA
jgi:glycosyltransferase involved in cell wall biosynthesis